MTMHMSVSPPNSAMFTLIIITVADCASANAIMSLSPLVGRGPAPGYTVFLGSESREEWDGSWESDRGIYVLSSSMFRFVRVVFD
jgi:hypothetical protein